jgi:hypothetical protein
MSRDRWHQIKWALTCTSDELDRPVVPEHDPGFDRCWKIRPALQALIEAGHATVKQGRNISLDEAMVKCTGKSLCGRVLIHGVFSWLLFTGRVVFRIRIPTKPIRDGIKVYALCDADTG